MKKEESKERKIELPEIIGLPDFDEAARRVLSSKAWAYMSAGATDMYSEYFSLIWAVNCAESSP